MKKLIFILFFILTLITFSDARNCQYYDIETYYENEYFICMYNSEIAKGKGLILSDLNDGEVITFIAYNPNDYDVSVKFIFNVTGYLNEELDFSTTIPSKEYKSIRKWCFDWDKKDSEGNLIIGNCSLEKNTLTYIVTRPEYLYPCELSVKKERKVCDKECNKDSDCETTICNIIGYCGDKRVVPCKPPERNCNDEYCIEPGLNDQGDAYNCDWECNDVAGDDGFCKTKDGNPCLNNNECLSGECNFLGFCGEAICPNGTQNCRDIECRTPNILRNGEPYLCEWECESGRGDEGVCLPLIPLWIKLTGFFILFFIIISFIFYKKIIVNLLEIKKSLDDISNMIKEIENEWNNFLKNKTYLKKDRAEKLIKKIKLIKSNRNLINLLVFKKVYKKKTSDQKKKLNHLENEIKNYNKKYMDIIKEKVDDKKEIIKKKIDEIKNHFKNTNYADYSDQEKKFIKIENILKEIKSIKDEYKEIYNISFSYLDKTTNKYFELLIQYREENNLFLFYKEIINNAYSELDKLEDKYKKVVDEDKYLIDSEGKKLSEESSISLSLIESYINDEKIKHSDVIKLLKEYETKIIKVSEKINNFNYNFVEEKKIEYKDLFNKGIPLDEHQKEAIIKDDKHNLVVAGAGSGKTEVLIKRIAYLIERKSDKIKPERIIALAFQNKAEDEIKNRLKERYNLKVDIKTFHSLGFDILKKAKKDYKLKFSGDNHEDKYNKFIKKIINQLKQKSEFQNKLINYMKYFDDNEEILDEEKFEEKEEFYNYMKNLRFTTLDKTKVKSKAEREIMNFFLTHKFNGEKIRIIYEHPATWMKESKESKIDIKPDFFFPKFNLYIEHWGIDKNGNPPPWFEGYKESMEYKKNQFKNQDKFKLIETFQWEYDEKILIKNLISKFEKIAGQKLKIEPIPYEELVKQVWEDCKQSVKSIDYSVSKFIRIAKTYDLSIDDIKNIMNENLKTEKQISFYDIAIDVYKKYEDILKKENRIDFNDMINLAIKELEINKNLFYNKIDHILIDEYQDISKQRYLLIKKLIERNNNCKLFCVGDDWQSIMGFTGSNLDYFVNFDKYFNNPCKTDLPINYRSIKSIVDTGKEIIKNNGEIQLFKETIAKNDKIKKIKIYSIHSHENNYFKYIVQKSLLKIKELIKKGYKNSDILILTRITKEQKLKENLEIYSSEYNIPINIEGNTPKGIPYMSIHKSKGLQAKAVIILNMRDHLYGFPCKIEDSELFKPLNQENHYIGLPEERRLFYVAVTRAKEEVYIYTHKYYESQFIKEINEYVEKEYL